MLLGDTLEEGMTLYTVADLSAVWVQAQIAEADLSVMKAGHARGSHGGGLAGRDLLRQRGPDLSRRSTRKAAP